MWLRRLRGRADERGLTLIELLVATSLMGVVSTLVVGAVVQSQRVLTHNDDENRGLQDAKVIMDRLGRDVREARSVVCDGGLADPSDPTSTDPYCASHLQLWIDANSDYVKQDNEVITWRLKRSTDGEHYDVWRSLGTGAVPVSQKREATSLWTKFAFTYDQLDSSGNPVFARVEQVRIEIQYDAIVGRGTNVRTAAFAARLRNKGD